MSWFRDRGEIKTKARLKNHDQMELSRPYQNTTVLDGRYEGVGRLARSEAP